MHTMVRAPGNMTTTGGVATGPGGIIRPSGPRQPLPNQGRNQVSWALLYVIAVPSINSFLLPQGLFELVQKKKIASSTVKINCLTS